MKHHCGCVWEQGKFQTLRADLSSSMCGCGDTLQKRKAEEGRTPHLFLGPDLGELASASSSQHQSHWSSGLWTQSPPLWDHGGILVVLGEQPRPGSVFSHLRGTDGLHWGQQGLAGACAGSGKALLATSLTLHGSRAGQGGICDFQRNSEGWGAEKESP